MTKFRRIFAVLMFSLFAVFAVAGYVSTYAASSTVKPQIKVHTQPSKEYIAGSKATFKVYSPNFSGKVEYRVRVYNNTKKTFKEIWPSSTQYYNKSAAISGKSAFIVSYAIAEPGQYKFIVYVRRQGSKSSYETYTTTSNFTVKAASKIASISPITASIDEGSTYNPPVTVMAKMSDGTSKSIAVTWKRPSSITNPGTYVYEGTVSGYASKVKLTLTVKKIPLKVESVY
jgi:hypothetical protein